MIFFERNKQKTTGCNLLLRLVLFFMLFISIGKAQQLTELFLGLPDSAVMNLSRKEREKIVKGQHSLYKLSVNDPKNGYLKMTGAFEGHFEMCYWNKEKNIKLVGIYEEACGPKCQINRFDFYEFDGKSFKAGQKNKIVSLKFEDFIKGDKTTAKKALSKQEIEEVVLFELPRTGLSIKAKLDEEVTEKNFSKYFQGNRVVLDWKNGTFIIQKFYWE